MLARCLNLVFVFLITSLAASAADRPNIVVMLADDMGFGELKCLNPYRGKIPTPQLDAIGH